MSEHNNTEGQSASTALAAPMNKKMIIAGGIAGAVLAGTIGYGFVVSSAVKDEVSKQLVAPMKIEGFEIGDYSVGWMGRNITFDNVVKKNKNGKKSMSAEKVVIDGYGLLFSKGSVEDIRHLNIHMLGVKDETKPDNGKADVTLSVDSDEDKDAVEVRLESRFKVNDQNAEFAAGTTISGGVAAWVAKTLKNPDSAKDMPINTASIKKLDIEVEGGPELIDRNHKILQLMEVARLDSPREVMEKLIDEAAAKVAKSKREYKKWDMALKQALNNYYENGETKVHLSFSPHVNLGELVMGAMFSPKAAAMEMLQRADIQVE